MKTLIVYDTTGTILYQTQGGSYIPTGVPFLEVEIPSNQMVIKIDTNVTPNIPIYTDIPKSDMEIANEKIAELEKENADINYVLMLGGLI